MDSIRFSDIAIGQVFFENVTGEYYVKMSASSAFVYDIGKLCVYKDQNGYIECHFDPTHSVEVEEV